MPKDTGVFLNKNRFKENINLILIFNLNIIYLTTGELFFHFYFVRSFFVSDLCSADFFFLGHT